LLCVAVTLTKISKNPACQSLHVCDIKSVMTANDAAEVALRLEWRRMLANWRHTGLTNRQRREMVRNASATPPSGVKWGVGPIIDLSQI
jgi:hypothetical protein